MAPMWREMLRDTAEQMGFRVDDDAIDLATAAHELSHFLNHFNKKYRDISEKEEELYSDIFMNLVLLTRRPRGYRDALKVYETARSFCLRDTHWRMFQIHLEPEQGTRSLADLLTLRDELFERLRPQLATGLTHWDREYLERCRSSERKYKIEGYTSDALGARDERGRSRFILSKIERLGYLGRDSVP
jgi:hypothetical protein